MHELGKLPGIGAKTAERLTHHLLGAERAEVFALSDALRAIKEQIRPAAAAATPRRGSFARSAPTRSGTRH
jgi:recombinational DNA repair protein RecR